MTPALRHRWYVPLAAFALLAIGITALAVVHVRGFRRDLRTRVERELFAVARLQATEIAEWRGRLLEDGADLQHPALALALAKALAPRPDPADVRMALYRLAIRARRQHLETGAVVDERGVVLLTTGPHTALAEEERVAVARAIGEGTPRLVDLAADPGAIRVIVPVLLAGTPRVAAIFGGRITASLPPSARTWPSPSPGAEAFLAAVHGDEVVIIDALRVTDGAAHPARVARSAPESPLALAARREEGVGPALDRGGARVLVARVRIPGSNWVLSASEDERALFAPARERERVLAFVVAALLAAAGVALAFWWRALESAIAARERDLEDQERQRALRARLATSDRLASIGSLAAGIAHEINNPLSYVISNLDFVQEAVARPDLGEDREAVTAAVSDSRHGVRRIAEIVRTLRRFSRSDRDGPPAPVDLREAVHAAALMAAHRLRGRARLELQLEDVPPVSASESELAQLVVNLLVNAAYAIPPAEGRSAREHAIRVATRPAGTSAVLEVSDDGVGMAPETLERIFDPFFTTRPPGEGTGLGLWVCHGVVERLGGRIEVESAVGAGSTFRVVLPAATMRAA